MLERARKSADDLEAARLPEMQGTCVRRDDEIELHGAKTKSSGLVERVQAERAANSMAPRIWQRHVTAIGDVRSRAAGVGLQIVGSNDALVFILGDEDRVRRLPPIGEGGF